MADLSDDDLLRYSRHIMLPEIDVAGQEALAQSHCVVMGLGGLGSPLALYLAAAGVGTLTLVDPDRVELSNLQRQILHQQDRIDRLKTESAAQTLSALRPGLQLELVSQELADPALAELFHRADVVADGTDRFSTRYAINRACWLAGTPLVSGAAIRFTGQVSVFNPKDPTSPCYQCLHPDVDANGGLGESCAESGVLSPLVGVIGALQSVEVVRLLTTFGPTTVGTVTHYDARYGEWRSLTLSRRPDCPVCGNGH